MRGWYGFGGCLVAGLVWNYGCHRRSLPTVSSDTRRLDPALFGFAWGIFTGWLFSHLYEQETSSWP